jgi:two-component system chemotaxis response regulator CheB
VVVHIGSCESILPAIFGMSSRLPVRQAVDGAVIEAGAILVAPSDRHLLVEDSRVRLSRGPKENHARPAIDPLFRSAAIARGSNVIGVVLTGQLDDGTVGLQAIKNHGGIAIVQDPADSEAPSMPRSALDYVDVDYCLPLDEIANTLVSLADGAVVRHGAAEDHRKAIMENRYAAGEDPGPQELDRIGTRSMQTCPECGGLLWEIEGAPPLRFRCHTGHAFTSQSLLHLQSRFSEDVLWSALRALHEKHTLLRRLASDARGRKAESAAAEHEAAAGLAEQHAEALRRMLSEAGAESNRRGE